MIFRSDKVSAQWDTWCFYHDGIYYLYYLITECSGGEGFGVATSSDGVHWNDHGWAIRASDQMLTFLGTGSVWPDPVNEGRFLCNYSEHRMDGDKQRQCILFAWSDDLINWHKFGDNYIFWIDEDHYERYGRWDCIFAIPRSEGGYWGTWTASPKGGTYDDGGIGIGFSEDGLNWQALPAPEIIPPANESGAMLEIDDKIHTMFGRFKGESGMNAYVADSLEGPFRQSEKNNHLLKAWHTYFSRFFETPAGTLINHHSMNGEHNESKRSRTFVAPFKKLSIDADGTQRWLWWSGNEVLKGNEVTQNDNVDFQQGIVIEGNLGSAPWSEIKLAVDDSIVTIQLTAQGEMTIKKDDTEIQTADRQFANCAKGNFRLLARQGMLEIYLDDMFMECCSLDYADAKTIHCNIKDETFQAWRMDL